MQTVTQNPIIQQVLTDLQMRLPEQAGVLNELCITCFMLGQQDEMVRSRQQLADLLMPKLDTATEYGEITPGVAGQCQTEVL